MDKREPLVVRARELILEAGFKIGNAHCALEVRKVCICLLIFLTILNSEQASSCLG